jgi:hypothetical protein
LQRGIAGIVQTSQTLARGSLEQTNKCTRSDEQRTRDAHSGWNSPAEAERAYAQVSRDGVQLHLAETSQGGEPAALLFRDMRRLIALHSELIEREHEFAPTQICFTQWDSRKFEVTDPFGNQLRFWENNAPGTAI